MTALGATADPALLIPGSPRAVLAYAAGVRDRSAWFAAERDRAARLHADGDWSGRASDAFERAVRRHRVRAEDGARSHGEAARRVEAFAGVLEWAQGEAGRAIALWDAEDAGAAPARTGGADARAEADQVLRHARDVVAREEALLVALLRALAEDAPTASLFARAVEAHPATLGEAVLLARQPELLNTLAALGPAELEEYARAHPDLAARLAELGPSAIAAWWAGLGEARERLVRGLPEIVGNLEGIPYRDRDAANVSRLRGLKDDADAELARAIERARTRAGPRSPAELQDAVARASAAGALLLRFGDGAAASQSPPRLLLALDAADPGPPLAAIAVGDPDTARIAAWLVPGMNSDLTRADSYLRGAENLWDGDPGRAVVLFLGYRSPGIGTVLGGDAARVGGERLGRMLDGYTAAREQAGVESRLVVIGHSYGTTVVTDALAARDHDVDAVALVASAGVEPTIGAGDLHIPPGGVWVTQATDDRLADLGRAFRDDPLTEEWGGSAFGSDGATLDDGMRLDGVDGHDAIGRDPASDGNTYLGKGTESLWNLQHIIAGETDAVTRGRFHPDLAYREW